jgi:hypothetical protein
MTASGLVRWKILSTAFLATVLLTGVAGCASPRNEPPIAEPDGGRGVGSRGATDGPAGSGSGDGPSACDQQACDLAVQDGCCPAACNSTSDADCNVNCGNGVIEPGETCDPPGSCPMACPNLACTGFTLQGAADQCTARCAESGQITGCTDGDGCCPMGCTADTDKDCLVVCGNGTKEGSETCDPLTSCPSECPPLGCQLRKLVNAGTCAAECIPDAQQTKCQPGDGCCPTSCNANNDPDCASKCGNGIVEEGEKCDPCPLSCPPDGCQLRRLAEAGTCNAQCVDDRREMACKNGDSCCPSACNSGNDNDCNARCGNGIKEGAELCDPCPASCPAQGCMLRKLENPGSCNARCVEDRVQNQCLNGDGCCPGSCNANNDNDCRPRCGNDVVEPGELCDGNCPGNCTSNGCNLRRLEGSGCNARCVEAGSQTQCRGGDGCCPDNCNANNDSDCRPQCGNRVVESGESCDGNCPGSCANNGCNLRRLEGSGCNVRCLDAGTQTQCRGNDGCCPGGCNASNDSDCNARCGNDVTEPGELCDRDCPRSCPSQGCTSFSPQGSPCNVRCMPSGTLDNGARCGGQNACFNGQCRSCPDSGGCNGNSNPCKNGVNRCNSGVPSCENGGNKADGTPCPGGSFRQCQGGNCVDCPNSGDCNTNIPECKLGGIRCVDGRSSCQVVGNTPRGQESGSCSGDRACDGRGACKLKDGEQCSRPGANECLGTCFGNCLNDPMGKRCTSDGDCNTVPGDTCLQDAPECH